jgi:hypothetical protein
MALTIEASIDGVRAAISATGCDFDGYDALARRWLVGTAQLVAWWRKRRAVMQTRLIRHTLTEFFRDLLQTAMRSQEVKSSELTEFYLVNLMEQFARPDTAWNDRPLALEYLESFHSPQPRRYLKLKRVGDTALFTTGIFMGYLERQLVSADYYISLGTVAYQHLATISEPQAEARRHVFSEIAEHFPEFVRVLSEISFEQLFRSNERLVRVYTRWLHTRGRQDAQWLLRHGIVPAEPGIRTRH